MSADSPSRRPPASPLGYRTLAGWLRACRGLLEAQGERGVMALLARLMGVSAGQARDVIVGQRWASARRS